VPNGAQDENPALTRRALKLGGADATPLLRDADGAVLAVWRAEQRGRLAVWSMTDSFALVLSGQSARHAELWSSAFATLARARTDSAPRIDPQPREQQRLALCGLGGNPRVVAADGQTTTLLPDPGAGDSFCAAYWPRQPGWHLLLQTDAEAVESAWPFFVYPTGAAPALRAAELRDSTARLQAMPVNAAGSLDHLEVPGRRGPSWPWFLTWLASAGALWWLERARAGRTSVAA
jgi:hypothetical protein